MSVELLPGIIKAGVRLKEKFRAWESYFLYRRIIRKVAEYSLKETVLLKDSFLAFFEELENFKPEAIVFLDLGSRSLARPTMEALKVLDIKDVAIRFVNPDPIIKFVFSNKSPVELDEEDLKRRFELLFAHLKQFSRIFFVDETFHSGRGLATLRGASKIIGFDFKYFAFSNTGYSIYVTSLANARIMRKTVSWRDGFPGQGSLALRELGRFYVYEKENGKTAPLSLDSFPDRIFEIDCTYMNKKQKERVLKYARLKAAQSRKALKDRIVNMAREYKQGANKLPF